MNKSNIMILFIISFVCVVFTINSISHSYIDNNVDKFFLNSRLIKIEKQATPNSIVTISIKRKLFISLTVAFISLLVFVYANKLIAAIFTLFFVIFYFISYKHFLLAGDIINIFSVYCSLLISLYFALVYKKVFKNDVSKKIESILSKYISSDIKNKILKNNNVVDLGGKRSEITVMFADIRGFTSLSETRKAEEVSQLLNEYFTELEPIISKYNGVINKFIGDAVLVVFGDPEQDKNHAKNAVKCAYELRKKVKEIRQRWIEEGKPKIDIGIGVNTGEAFIGNVGTKNRFEYTVIGDTVNIASRIDDYNKIYKTNVLISESTYSKISQIVDAIKIREVSIKGKRQKINIYEVLRITE